MQESILSKLETSRKELLDLGLRNPLLHYRPLASKGLDVTQEQSDAVFDLLVNKGKPFTFLPKMEKVAPTEPLEPEASDAFTDTRLQTTETEQALQQKLLNTFYAARTGLEEQGVNTLYLALGQLVWREAESGKPERRAPLVLIPVALERSTARERFRLRYTGEDVGENLSLQAKLKADFGITLPEMQVEEAFLPETYFEKVEAAVCGQPEWKVDRNAICLGFFSFAKFLLYNDLDPDRWPAGEGPQDHPLLQSLLGGGFREEQPMLPDTTFMDDVPAASDLFQVVDADSSQLLAMLSVHEGRNLLIQGPPGTGKSQTITNIIANAVGQGKKVLFVAEKMAALEVVKRRLDSANLGEACLELHSHKTSKKELHQELRRVLELGKPAIYRLQQEVALLQKNREEINAYAHAVNASVGNSSLTVQQIFGHLLQLYPKIEGRSLPVLSLPEIENWDERRMKSAQSLADRIMARLAETGMPEKLLFWGCGLRILLPHEQETLAALLKETAGATSSLQKVSHEIAGVTGLPEPENREDSLRLSAWLQLAAAKPDLSGYKLLSPFWLQHEAMLADLLKAGSRLKELHTAYEEILIPEAWQQEVLPIRQELVSHGGKWFSFLNGSYNKAVKQLKGLCKGPLPKENEVRIKYVDDLLEARRLSAAVMEAEPVAFELFGRNWLGIRSDWERIRNSVDFILQVHRQVEQGEAPETLLEYLNRQEPAELAAGYQQLLLHQLNHHGKLLQSLTEMLGLESVSRFGGKTLGHLPYGQQTALMRQWIDRLPEIHQVISWNNLTDIAASENLSVLTKTAESWMEAGELLGASLRKTWYEYLLQQAVSENPALRRFERATHEEVIRQFQRLDTLNFQYNQARAALKHWEALPPLEAGGQVTVLRTEFNKKARHLPVRKLMQEAGLAIQAIKPVFMMSPLSIANFLPPGALEFDLVIFDEASQVRPVDALGALLRARQLVVVGDTKQLPPTSFFDNLYNEPAEEEESLTADMPSILGLCDAQGAPQRMLRWHYRSRHESLIHFSNHEFYENKLVVFPAPGSAVQAGLFFHHLKDTVYDRGRTRTNPEEAEIVAEAVMEHSRKHPYLSLGVVAFSTAQRQAIQDALEKKRRQEPASESFFRGHPNEPFFVKNLENVQGDERDVILISIGYGRTADGSLSMSFGPLNVEGGERRLNVLITRARLRCEVFANITATDLESGRSKAYGVRALQSFLYYAEHGRLPIPAAGAVPEENPFEEEVASRIRALGYEVQRKVGSGGYFLDMAVVHPQYPGRYVLGIECDGAAYQSARSARDRDRLRQQILEGMGWKLHRVWSTDWFRHPEGELERVEAAIRAACQEVQEEDQRSPKQKEEILLRERVPAAEGQFPLYRLATLPQEVEQGEINRQPVSKLAGWLEEVVRTESPVHMDEVARRIADAAGAGRVGPRLKDHLQLAAKFAQGSGKVLQKSEFLWHADMPLPTPRNRSQLPAAARKLKYIAPEEMGMAIQKVVRDAVAIGPEAAVPFVGRLFGFSRITEEMRNELLEQIQRCVENGQVAMEGNLLKAAEQ